MTSPDSTTPWYAAFPEPRNVSPPSITSVDVLNLLEQALKAEKDFVLIDLRREDYTGGTIRGSLNLPAQTLYSSIPTLYEAFSAAGVKKVIFYCGSSAHRGARAAGWFDDYIIDKGGNSSMKSLVLVGGINGWAQAGDRYVQQMDGYDDKRWQD